MRTGHTPMWPDFPQRSIPDRKIAIFDGKRLYLEDMRTLTVDDFMHLISLLFAENVICFVESLSNRNVFPYLKQAVQSTICEVSATEKGHPLSITIKWKNKTRWIVPEQTWGRTLSGNFFVDMRETYSYFQCVKPTPGSFGQTLLRRDWYQHRYPKETAPNVAALRFLREHGVGGRCDTFGPLFQETGHIYPSLVELDIASAYLAHFMDLPVGTSHKFLHDNCWHYATFFAECHVTIHHELPLGPFPMKAGDKIVYPTLPGTYVAYLWREEILDCIAADCSISIHGGYGWSTSSNHSESWSRYMHNARIQAPNDSIGEFAKKLAVAAIGRFGMRNTYYILVDSETALDSEPCMVGDDLHGLDYYIREHIDYSRASMYHWFQKCIRECARTLYAIALPYAQQGRLVMTNYDAILVLEQDETHIYVEKHTLAAKMCELGDLRWQRLTGVKVLGNRSLECDQKVTRPGVPVESR